MKLRLDMLVIEKLGENRNSIGNEQINGINGRVQNPQAMGVNGLRNLRNTNGQVIFLRTRGFQEFLLIQTVAEHLHKIGDVAQNIQNVHLPLFYGLTGNIGILEVNPEVSLRKLPHFLVDFKIMPVEDVEAVERLVQVRLNHRLDIKQSVEKIDFFNREQLIHINGLFRVCAIDLINQR